MNISDEKSTSKPYMATSLSKAFSILKCFSLSDCQLSAAQLMNSLDITSTSLYRYLRLLEDEGFLTHVPDTKKYALSLKFVELAGIALYPYDVYRYGQLELNAMTEELGINSFLGVLYEGDQMNIAYCAINSLPTQSLSVGRRIPPTLTAIGKVLLAELPFKEVQRLVEKKGWRPHTENSIKDFDHLKTELKVVKEQGYAVNIEENRIDRCSIAAPVRQRDGKVIAAMSLATSREIYRKKFDVMLQTLLYHSDQVSEKLGYFRWSTEPTR